MVTINQLERLRKDSAELGHYVHKLNKKGKNETLFLNHLQKVIDEKTTNADHMVNKFSRNENLSELYDK